jgi:hypothetical protein
VIHQASIRLALRLGLATTWAALLVLAGLWAMTVGSDRLPTLGSGWLLLGITAVAMGQFVFAALVADRLFPHASVRLTLAFEASAAAAYVAGLIVMVIWVAGVLA